MSSLSRREITLTLAGINLALFLGALDQTIVSTALPKIVEDLDGLTRYAWVATTYLIASTIMVPIVGKLADTYPRRRIQIAAVVIFLFASILCGLAGLFGSFPVLGDGMTQLIIFRSLQGVGSAGLFAMAFIVIADLFPPAERGKYIGLISGTWAIASLVGPVVGGFLADFGGWIPGIAGWRWVFLINLPVGALALWFILRHMPNLRPPGSGRPPSIAGGTLLVVGLVPLILALQLDKRTHPWSSTLTLGLLVVGTVGTIAFVWHARRTPAPILNLGLFSRPIFRITVIAVFLYGSAFLSLIIFLPVFLVNVLGISATAAGTALIPLTVGVSIGAMSGGQLAARLGRCRPVMLGAGLTALVGLGGFALMPIDVSLGRIVFFSILCGLGLGPTMPLYPLAVQNVVPRHEIGQATSACQFFRQIGGATGTAILGTILTFFLVVAQGKVTASTPAGSDGAEISVQSGISEVQTQVTAEWETAYQQWLRDRSTEERLPASLRVEIATSEDAPDANAVSEAIHSAFTRFGAEESARVANDLRQAFHEGVVTIFRWVFLVSALAWAVTWILPDPPLRREH